MHANMKLGKLPKVVDPRTLQLATYFDPDLVYLPAESDWSLSADRDWTMMGNRNVGCCTCAAAGHMEQAWTATAGVEVTATEAQILAAYKAVSGWDGVVGSPSDRGASMLAVLKYWKGTGIGGRKIDAYVEIDPANDVEIRAACWLFGGVYLGLDLPITAQSQEVWDDGGSGPDAVGGSWGGHAVNLVQQKPDGGGLVTWGALKRFTTAFRRRYCSEAYAVLSTSWLSDGMSIQGLDLTKLRADLGKVAQL